MIDIKELIWNPTLKKELVWITLSVMIKGQKTPTLLHQEAGRGPAICDVDGFLMSNAAMNDLFWTILEELYVDDKDAFPESVTRIEEIRNLTNIYRTMRRSSHTQSVTANVAETDYKIVERWRGKHYSKGKAPGEEMHVHYAEQELLNKCFERYTSAM